jgi:hypothetical protein
VIGGRNGAAARLGLRRATLIYKLQRLWVSVSHEAQRLFFQPKALRRMVLARNKRDLVAVTEMPARSAISLTELSFD